MKKERLKIGFIYSSISLFVMGLCFWLILGFWYPGVMPVFFGMNAILTIFIVVNLLIFPFLSVFICKEDKKEQKRDLIILTTLQIIISSTMMYFISQIRPLWLALVVDSFEIVRTKDIQPDERPHSSVANTSLFAPYKIVGASFSQDPKIAKEQRNNDLFGKSIAWYPSAIVPISEKMKNFKKYAQPLARLNQYNPKEKVASTLKKYPQATSYFPLKGYVKDGAVLTNKEFTWFQPVDLWPWEDDSLLTQDLKVPKTLQEKQ